MNVSFQTRRPEGDALIRLIRLIRLQTEIVRQGLEPESVMNLVVERLPELTDADGAIVELVEGSEMVYHSVSGLAESFSGLRLKRESSLSGFCVEEGRTLRCRDAETDPRVDRQACRIIGLRDMIVSPLLHMGEPVGVVKVLSRQPGHFTEEAEQVLELMSDLLGATLYNALRFQDSELLQRAMHDPLTGIGNRGMLLEHLAAARLRSEQMGAGFALLMLDMDGLKTINDTLGHRFGDAALKEVGRRLQEMAREADCVARIGGDEFAVLLQNITEPDCIAGIADRFTGNMEAPYEFEDRSLMLRASLGAAHFPEDASSIEALMDCADERMYRCKRDRKAKLR